MEPLQVDESPLKNKSWGRSGEGMTWKCDGPAGPPSPYVRTQPDIVGSVTSSGGDGMGAEGVCFL